MNFEDLPDMLAICRRASERRVDVGIALDARLASGASPVLDDGADLRDALACAEIVEQCALDQLSELLAPLRSLKK